MTSATVLKPITDASHTAPRRKSGGEAPKFRLVPFEQIKVDLERRPYLVKGLLPNTGLSAIWGPPKCGKSFWALDVGMHIALGWEYRGRRVQGGPVVYVALEGSEGFKARIEAFRRRHQVTRADFFLITAPLNMVAERGALVADIRAQLGDIRPAAVFIDTLNRSLKGSESKDEDMAAYISAAEEIAAAFACHVPIVHHCGVDASRPRGHTSLTGAVEAQIAVKREGEGFSVTLEYMKDGPEGDTLNLRLEQVVVGADPDGDDITTCIVEDSSPAAKARQRVKLAQMPAAGLRQLHECLAESGKPSTPSEHVPAGVTCVTLDAWKDRMVAAGILNAEGNPREQFRRIRVTLINAGLIGVWEGSAWSVT
ncbi:MAG TPA: AAA family ATPase [Xanthobacteraceae bacterium]|nr:AAA family ATPase [Xanthobacteraceae bacterium]